MKNKTPVFIEKCNKCQYPNLAVEIIGHSYHCDTFANHGNITTELLTAFLIGEQEIELHEALGMARVANQFQTTQFSISYLLAKRLGYYDMTKKKHRRKVMLILHRCDKIRQSVDIERLCKEGKITSYDRNRYVEMSEKTFTSERANQYMYIGRVEINRALRFADELKEMVIRSKYINKPRGITPKKHREGSR